MKKFVLIIFSLLAFVIARGQDDAGGGGFEQDDGAGEVHPYKPVAGDFSVSFNFGRYTSQDNNIYYMVPESPYNVSWDGSLDNGKYWDVTGNGPNTRAYVSTETSASNMVGIEGRYFITDEIAVRLNGLGIYNFSPEYQQIEAYTSNELHPSGRSPFYDRTIREEDVQLRIAIGGEYHFDTKYERMRPYLGLQIPFHYQRATLYDPYMSGLRWGADLGIDDGTGSVPNPNDPDDYNDLIFPDAAVGDPYEPVDLGNRIAEQLGYGIEVLAGIDYYLMEGLYLGVEIKPVNFIYFMNRQQAAPGLEVRMNDTYHWSFFTQPMLKLGFRF